MEPQHAFPNLYLIGAPRAGTTFLFDLLSQSKDIFAPRDKEPTYFHFGGHSRLMHKGKWLRNRRESRKEDAYLGLYRERTDERWAIDGSTYYLSDPASADRIARHSPDAKILVVLREPIKRAFSHYLMERRDGWVVETFEQALAQELDELKAPQVPYAGHYHFIRGSRYVAGLKSFLDAFGPENLLVFRFEDLVSDSQSGLEAICDFLSIDRYAPDSSEVRQNSASLSRNRMGTWIASRYRHSTIRNLASSLIPEFLKDGGRALLMHSQSPSGPEPSMSERARIILSEHLESEMEEATTLCEEAGVFRDSVMPL